MLNVNVITPEKPLFSEQADFIAAPALDGEVGILPGHAPFLTQLGYGELRLRRGDQTRSLALAGGFLEVHEGSRVEIFAETAEMGEEIDLERARMDAERARSSLGSPESAGAMDLAKAEMELKRALLRLKVAEGIARRRDRRPSGAS